MITSLSLRNKLADPGHNLPEDIKSSHLKEKLLDGLFPGQRLLLAGLNVFSLQERRRRRRQLRPQQVGYKCCLGPEVKNEFDKW